MKLFLVLTSLMFITISAKAYEVVVLVPGFFNSFTPEYFSRDIVNAFTSKGIKVYVANELNGIGTIDENGTRLETYLKTIELHEGRHVDFNLVAHSAGGFYSLLAAHRQHFSIKNIFTISTPYLGVEFVQTWLDNCLLFSELTKLAHLESLRELTSAGAETFLKTIRIPSKTKVTAFGGFQRESFDVTDARNISVPLLVTSHYITRASDGVVSYSSGIGLSKILTTENKPAQMFVSKSFFIALEHWEQTLDSHSFLMLGIRNTDYIRQEQNRFYSGIADLVLKP